MLLMTMEALSVTELLNVEQQFFLQNGLFFVFFIDFSSLERILS